MPRRRWANWTGLSRTCLLPIWASFRVPHWTARPRGPLLAGRRPSWPAEAGTGRLSPAWRAAWGSWLAISLFLFAVWLLSGAAGGLWFLWVVLPLGVLMLGRWMTGAPAPGKRRSAARHDPEPRDDQSPRR